MKGKVKVREEKEVVLKLSMKEAADLCDFMGGTCESSRAACAGMSLTEFRLRFKDSLAWAYYDLHDILTGEE